MSPGRISLSIVLVAFAGCGGGGGGDGRLPVSGVVELQGRDFRTVLKNPSGALEREVNDDAFRAEDLGELGEPRWVSGTLSGESDAADYFRIVVPRSGAVRVTAESVGSRPVLTVFRLMGGRAPFAPIARATVGEVAVAVPVAAGDHLIVGVTGRLECAYRFELAQPEGVEPAGLGVSAAAAAAALDEIIPSSYEFVPGELLVQFARDDVDGLRRIGERGWRLVSSGYGYRHLRSQHAAVVAPGRAGREAFADVIFGLRRDLPELGIVEPNFICRRTVIPNDPRVGEQWGLVTGQVFKAWDITVGNGKVIAVIDSGVVHGHPDLKDNVLVEHGWDFVDNDPDANEPDSPTADYHGSHVAGIAAAVTDNRVGIAGVGWNARILPVRAGPPLVHALAAMAYVGQLENPSQRIPGVRADILNMSYGRPARSELEEFLTTRLLRDGMILVAAAGNEGTRGIPVYPAAFPGVIAVGASNRARDRASYSNMGDYVDVVAPGGDEQDRVLSTVRVRSGNGWDYGYTGYEGTSMAAPFVAGAISLMLAVNPDLRPADIEAIFAATSLDRGLPGKDDEYGWGLINVWGAVGLASCRIAVSQRVHDFGLFEFTRDITLDSLRPCAVFNLRVESSVPWIRGELSSTTVPAVLTLMVDRTGAIGGRHRGEVTVLSTAPDARIDVSMEAAIPPPRKPIVVQFRDDTGAVVHAVNALADGRFDARLLPGGYRMFAGIDSDGNGSFDDAGDWASAVVPLTVEAGQPQLRLRLRSMYHSAR